MANRKKTEKNKKKKASRHIPENVSDNVRTQHFFQCAWCGVHLTDRHHIHEYAAGGEHTVENLILLCPDHHRMVHNGEIPHDELISRKSTHSKGDHISGGLQFDLPAPSIKLGGTIFEETAVLLAYKDNPIISLRKFDDSYYLDTKFYDQDGNLIFWMSRNMYWTMSHFEVSFSGKKLKIKSQENDDYFLNIYQEGNVLKMEGKNFLEGEPFTFDSEKIHFYETTIKQGKTKDCGIGIGIECSEFYQEYVFKNRKAILSGKVVDL